MECARQRFVLDRFSFYRSHLVSWETGFRIVCRTIKRGSRMSSLIASFGESSNLCILGIIFLGCYLDLIHVWIVSLSLFPRQAQVHRKRISYAFSIAFSFLRFLPVLHFERFHTSPSFLVVSWILSM